MRYTDMIDSTINDLNTLLKEAVNGQFIKACIQVSNIAGKLIDLREKMDADLAHKDEVIKELKRELMESGKNVDNGE